MVYVRAQYEEIRLHMCAKIYQIQFSETFYTKQFASKLNLTKVVLQSHHTVFTRNYTMTTILRFADYTFIHL